eukprot:CAMPEP_0181484364 /NCGR_PEP_ID=MMETSP1110-20121109/45949_1 /TAXON_ID=174948 /ORGANISM="Symbiodinium sp., Strain CCMP421" /LENGTH=203 /DNA_ID=CAMNT_0023610205 /DNA_START=312 /DNA_END=924 /DNA_ORIENTATION=-
MGQVRCVRSRLTNPFDVLQDAGDQHLGLPWMRLQDVVCSHKDQDKSQTTSFSQGGLHRSWHALQQFLGLLAPHSAAVHVNGMPTLIQKSLKLGWVRSRSLLSRGQAVPNAKDHVGLVAYTVQAQSGVLSALGASQGSPACGILDRMPAGILDWVLDRVASSMRQIAMTMARNKAMHMSSGMAEWTSMGGDTLYTGNWPEKVLL